MKRIFCIGHTTYDITFQIDEYIPENKKVKTNQKIECKGGSASTVATLLSLWKEKAYFIGTVGLDTYGKKIINAFKLQKVNTKYISKRFINTSLSFILANYKNGQRTIYTYKDPRLKSTKKVKEKADILFFDGEEYDLALDIIKNNEDAIKIIDAGSYKQTTINLCQYMDYVVCSNDFAFDYMKIEKSFDIETLTTIAKKMEEDFNAIIVITLEEKGSFAKINDEYKIVESIKVKAKDSTGAGDIYHGAFTYFLSQDYPFEKVIYLSNIAGALSVTKVGGMYSIPALEEVLKYDK